MSSPVVAVRPTEPVAHARRLMLKHGIKHLIVMDRGKLVGILSPRDIVGRLEQRSSPIRHRPIDLIPIASVMRGHVTTVPPTTEISKAAGLMLKLRIGSLVVEDHKRIVGIATKTDFTRYFWKNLAGEIKVKDLMTPKVLVVNPQHSLVKVTSIMNKSRVSRLVVADGDTPIGVITTSDLIFAQLERAGKGIGQKKVEYTRKPARGEKPKYRYIKYIALMTAEDMMTPNPKVVDAEDDAVRAAELMCKLGIGGLPVVKEKKLIGMITKSDLLRWIAGR
jgi:CBS domain-containing protein